VSDGKGRIRVTGVDLEGFTVGIQGPGARVSLTDTTMQGILAIGADVRRLDVDGVTIALLAPGNCITAFFSRVAGKDLTLAGCDSGITAGRSVSLTGLTSSGGIFGVMAKRVKLVDSSVTGSAVADVASGRFPRLTNTSCDRSVQLDSSGVATATPWGVCTND
jgi:hypothetical protein